jgi:integrase
MASIIHDPDGRKRILFVAGDGSRKAVRLGKCSERDAEGVCRHVEALAAETINGQSMGRETASWLAEVGNTLHARLARAGLAEARADAGIRLNAFIDGYLAQRPDLKQNTLSIMRQAQRHAVEVLGDKALHSITPADGDSFKAAMVGRGCTRATVNKWTRYVRHYLEVAKRRKLLVENPFQHLKGAVTGDSTKRRFVPAADVLRVIDAAPDPEWKLLIALARFGGLRMPSEAFALKWSDVDWEHERFTVRATKTEHHEHGGIRVVPIFPELKPYLLAVFEKAEPGAEYVITRYRDPAANLRTQLGRYIVAAGLTPWPKPWQNLRASRATELVDHFPSHVCAAWLGHTEAIADAFYRQVTEDHFQRAAQNPAQKPHADTRKASQDENPETENPANCGAFRGAATTCDATLSTELGRTGIEPVTHGFSVHCSTN